MKDFLSVWRDLLGLKFLLDSGKVSNSKVAVLFVSILVGLIVWHEVDVPGGISAIQWFLLASFTTIISGAMGRTVWLKHLETREKVAATHSTAITGDAAAMIKATADAIAARRETDKGVEPTP